MIASPAAIATAPPAAPNVGMSSAAAATCAASDTALHPVATRSCPAAYSAILAAEFVSIGSSPTPIQTSAGAAAANAGP